jgi:hypothetical protein
MRVYCDTNTLFHNMSGEKGKKAEIELPALRELLGWRQRGNIATKELDQRDKLMSDYESLDQIPRDEKVIGFENRMDRFGGPTNPFVSDVQNETLYNEIFRQLEERLGTGNDTTDDKGTKTHSISHRPLKTAATYFSRVIVGP